MGEGRYGLDTSAVHAGAPRPGIRGAVITPIFQTAQYEMAGDGMPGYIRTGNTPNHESLCARVAALEGAEAGVVMGSGMAATTAAIISHVKAGDHIVAQDSLYGGTYTFLTEHLPALGVTTTFVNADRPETWKGALRPTTRLFWCESLTNPLVGVPDLEGIAGFCREHGVVSMIDNTFASPVLFNPIAMGFDLVMHSATKYLNGHSDLVAGAVVSTKERAERVARTLRTLGGALDPHACFLLDRGIKTLGVRVRRQCETALVLARYLSGHEAVSRVHYPGLEGSPAHGRARAWFRGFGGMLSFELKGGTEAAERLLSRARVFIIAGSLGGVESLMVRPATASHRGVPREQRLAMGISDGLIRVSVGLEDSADLIEDLRRAMA